MRTAIWIASALLTLGSVGCDRSSSPPTMPESALPETTLPSTAPAKTAPAKTTSTPTTPTSTTPLPTVSSVDESTAKTAAEEPCPIRAEADAITTVDVPDGAALVFTADDATEKRELRQELEAIASDQAASTAEPKDWVPSATDARTEEMGTDVRIVFTNNTNVDRVRSEVRDRADDLNGRCTRHEPIAPR